MDVGRGAGHGEGQVSPTAIILVYLAGLLVHLVLDAIWLGAVARNTYKTHLGPLMRPRIRWGAAAAFYLVYGLGTLWFAAMPAAVSGTPLQALALGGLLGLVAYGTYDLTNLATLRNWPVAMTVIDLAWGVVASAISAVAGALAGIALG